MALATDNRIYLRVRPKLLWQLAAILIVLTTLLIRIFIAPERSADFAAYVEIAEDLRGTPLLDLFPFEPLSRGQLALLVDWIPNSISATIFAHWLNTAIFLALFLPLAARAPTNWQGMLLVWCIYGPLLSFVTLRATPAYLLVAYAVMIERTRPRMSISLCIVAAGFHISAAAALLSLLVNLFIGSVETPRQINRLRKVGWALLAACLTGYVMIMSGGFRTDILESALGQQEDLAKFVVYVGVIANEQSLFHRIYYAALATFVGLILTSRSTDVIRLIPFTLASFTLVTLASISPVVAFRLSPYWTIPLFLSFPWGLWVRGSVLQTGWAISCVTIYTLSTYSVLA